MQNYTIEDTKEFIKGLFEKEKYDSFYLYEARINQRIGYYINGKQNKEYFDLNNLDDIDSEACYDEYISWKEIKSELSRIIDEENMPVSFKLILMFNRDNVERLISMNNLAFSSGDVSALFYNVYYENGKVQVTTGSSLKIFSLDKSLDNIWDETVLKYYI